MPLPADGDRSSNVSQHPVTPPAFGLDPAVVAAQKCTSDVAKSYTYVTVLSPLHFLLIEDGRLEKLLDSALLQYSPGVRLYFQPTCGHVQASPLCNLLGMSSVATMTRADAVLLTATTALPRACMRLVHVCMCSRGGTHASK